MTTITGRDKQLLLHVYDSLMCVFLFFPSMVIYWRGIWDLWGVYIFPGDYPAQQWTLLGIGSVSYFGYLLAPLVDSNIKNTGPVVRFIFSRGYMYLYAALYMCFWRGHWDIADYYFDKDALASLINLLAAFACLILLRGSRCAIFPPLVVLLDTRYNALEPSTRFHTQVRHTTEHCSPATLINRVKNTGLSKMVIWVL